MVSSMAKEVLPVDALNEILNEAIPRWAKLTGTKLGTNAFSFTVGSNSEFQSWDLQKYVKDLNESRALDITGTTAILLLRGLFEGYVKEKSFSVHALLYVPDKIEKTMAALRSFHELITRPPCEEAVTAFRETVREVAVHYGYDLGKLKKYLDDERARRAAPGGVAEPGHARGPPVHAGSSRRKAAAIQP